MSNIITIHTIGDSHCNYGFHRVNIPNVRIRMNRLRSRLMYSVGRDGLEILDLSKPEYKINSGDIVIVSYGEIDARKGIRMHLKSLDTDEYKENINNIVNNFFKVLNQNVKILPNTQCCVFNIIPPTKNTGKLEKLEGFTEEIDSLRLKHTLYMNQELKRMCSFFKSYKYIFFDVYNKYADKEGYLKEMFVHDGLHIVNPIYYTEFIKNRLLK